LEERRQAAERPLWVGTGRLGSGIRMAGQGWGADCPLLETGYRILDIPSRAAEVIKAASSSSDWRPREVAVACGLMRLV